MINLKGLISCLMDNSKDLDLLVWCLEKSEPNIFYQMVVKNGDESHGKK